VQEIVNACLLRSGHAVLAVYFERLARPVSSLSSMIRRLRQGRQCVVRARQELLVMARCQPDRSPPPPLLKLPEVLVRGHAQSG
jgi:hypothetical protein